LALHCLQRYSCPFPAPQCPMSNARILLSRIQKRLGAVSLLLDVATSAHRTIRTCPTSPHPPRPTHGLIIGLVIRTHAASRGPRPLGVGSRRPPGSPSTNDCSPTPPSETSTANHYFHPSAHSVPSETQAQNEKARGRSKNGRMIEARRIRL
jgi:hypothetical protein